MTTPTIDDLLVIPTVDQLKAQLLSVATTLKLKVTSWSSGDPFRTLLAAAAAVLYAEKGDVATIAKFASLEDAEGGWLTILAKQRYNVDRIEATYAEDSLTVTNSGGGVYDFDEGEFLVKSSTTGKIYANTAAFHLGAASSATITVRALEAGTGSNAPATTIDTLVTTLTAVTVSNPNDLVAVDAELDDDLKQRCREKPAALSPNGPKDAIAYVCRTPDLNGGVTITRVQVDPPTGAGSCNAWIADADGEVSPANVALVQSGVDDNATQDIATINVQSATGHALSYDVTAYVDQGLGISDSDWQTAITNALLAWVPLQKISGLDLDGTGGKIHFRRVIGAIEAVTGVLQGKLAVEADVALSNGEVATLVDSDVTVTVVQVTP